MREREREGKQLVQKSALFWNSLSSRLLFPLIFFSHIAIPQTSFKKQTKGSWHQTINNADTQIGVKCFGFHNVRLNGSSCTYVRTRAQIHIVHCRGFFPISNIYFLVSSQCDKKVHMHTHYALSHIQPSTHSLTRTLFYCMYTHRLFTALMSPDDKAWQTSLFGTHFGLVASLPAPISLFSPLLFIPPTRATQSSSLSTAPIHHHTAITCRCSVIDYFHMLMYWPIRLWGSDRLDHYVPLWLWVLFF